MHSQFHRGAPQDEALARLSYAVEHRLGACVLTGPTGVGKSTVLAELRELRRQGAAVALVGVGSPRELLWTVAAQWGLFPDRQADLFALWRDVADRLVQLRHENTAAVILLDDLSADDDVARCIRQLAAADPHPEARLTLIAAVETSQLAQLPRTLKDLIDLRIELEPWEQQDTSEAVEDTNSSSAFTADALDELYALTDGVPRQVTRLARFSTLAAAAEQLDAVDPQTLVVVQDELLLR